MLCASFPPSRLFPPELREKPAPNLQGPNFLSAPSEAQALPKTLDPRDHSTPVSSASSRIESQQFKKSPSPVQSPCSNGATFSQQIPTTAVTSTAEGSPAVASSAAWHYAPVQTYSAVAPDATTLLNVNDYTSTAPQVMFADSSIADAYSDVHSATKSLFQAGTATLPTQYYGSAMYNGQSLPYGSSTAGFYGSPQQQGYYAASRGLKAPTSSLTAPLNPYFASAAAPYYGASYATQAPLDYGTAYGYPTSAQYYSATAYGAGQYGGTTPAATTTATYQLAQLPPCTTLAGNVPDTSANAQTTLDLSPFVKPEKKSKSKKKKAANPSPSPESDFERVFVWDLDETCVLFHSLLSGAYASKFGKDAATCVTLGLRMEELVYSLSETHFFLSDLEDCDQVHIDDIGIDETGQDLTGYNFTGDGFQLTANGPPLCLSSATGMRGGVDWMRKLAIRYRRIRDLYNLYKENVGGLVGVGKADHWIQLRNDIETLTDSWHTLALKCLAVTGSRPRYANVLVTSNHLVPSVAKTLLYGLGPVFPIENIYSASKIGKEACFERLQNRFGKKCTYVVVGSGRDEEATAKQMQLPFWRISTHSDLAALHHALDLGHL